MATINDLKELEITQTPLLLFECRLRTGQVEYWSTHAVAVEGNEYQARVLGHNIFEIGIGAEDGIDGMSRVSITLANADSHFSQVERNTGWKGSRLTVRFVFFDLKQGVPASESTSLFQGAANSPDEITESAIRLTFTNRLNLQRVLLPSVRIQKRCPWMFPVTAEQRTEGVTGGDNGKYSPFFRCGYSPDVEGGTGNLDSGSPYTSCGYTRWDCAARGMFSTDAAGIPTRRFGGIEFVPPSITVRSYGEKGSHVSTPLENQARYDDFVPVVYGTAWLQPPIVFARSDGNLMRMEVLLAMGEIQGVLKVLVNDVDIPPGQAGANMTATGWYNLASPGNRTGNFNYDFSDTSGQPIGDPYGSMALLSVVTPSRIANGRALPRIEVLLEGMKLSLFGSDGGYIDEAFTNNPAWVLLDMLRRSGWLITDIDTGSFADVAAHCDELVQATDLNGNSVMLPRFQCNLVLRRRRSAADIIRGIRNASALYLSYNPAGLLQLRKEGTLQSQQPVKPGGSNSAEPLNGGWPAYEFGDGSLGFSGILRRDNGEPGIRIRTRSSADSPNRMSVEFQDELNEYQQDSLALLDFDDVLASGHEVATTLNALGLPNFSQASRILRLNLAKAIHGNTFVEIETSVRGFGLRPGDIIAVTYLREGFQRQPFRIIGISPALNHRTAIVTAQWHDDAWYTDLSTEGAGERRQPSFDANLPRPLVGKLFNESGDTEFEISERSSQDTDGGANVTISVGFIEPAAPALSVIGIPILGLSPSVETTGGTLQDGQTLYYAVSALDSNGAETPISFLARAITPIGTDTNRVIIQNLSFPLGTASFNVYRGKNPAQMLRIAADLPVAATFTDDGAAVTELAGPPDEHFDHANIYWRLELSAEQGVTIATANSIGNSSLEMLENEYRGAIVRITGGKGKNQERPVSSNDATTLLLARRWDIQPDSSSTFVVAESAWHLGAVGSTSPLEFQIPNREGATIHVSGRAANVADQECAYELSPLTPWRIGGSSGSILDHDTPETPVFGLSSSGRGLVELVGLSFIDLTNTRTIAAATIALWYWDELSSPTQHCLGAALTTEAEYLQLNIAGSAQAGSLIQIGSEVLVVLEVLDGGLRYRVDRSLYGTTASAHNVDMAVYHLESKVFIASFSRDFFGSPASGSYCYTINLANARIAAADLFVTNAQGESPLARRNFTATTEYGIRTLSGGQLTIQVEGHLAIQSDVAPPLIVDGTHAVRDIFAMVREAPTEFPIDLRVKQSGAEYCVLSIPAGMTISNAVDGFGLPPLMTGAEVSVDIISVGQTATSSPGRDLTVTIRL